MKTSSPKSATNFSPGRFLWILLAALLVSALLYWAFRPPLNNTETAVDEALVSEVETQTATDAMIGIQPPSFQQITEFRDGSAYRLRLTGDAEPDVVIILSDREGKRLRQVRVNEQGQWGATLDVESSETESRLMVLYAEIYTDENLPSIRSEETIFRLQIPDNEKQVLIMVTAPGSPSQIIQSPFGGVPTAGPLGLSVIDYDHSGGVIITGTSSIPGRIRIYAEDSVIGETGVGVSGRWNYIAGRMLPPGEVEIRAELIPAQGAPNAPEGPVFISLPFNLLPPLQADQTDGQGDLSVNIEPSQWQVRRTLIGGGGQSTVIYSPEAGQEEDVKEEANKEEAANE